MRPAKEMQVGLPRRTSPWRHPRRRTGRAPRATETGRRDHSITVRLSVGGVGTADLAPCGKRASVNSGRSCQQAHGARGRRLLAREDLTSVLLRSRSPTTHDAALRHRQRQRLGTTRTRCGTKRRPGRKACRGRRASQANKCVRETGTCSRTRILVPPPARRGSRLPGRCAASAERATLAISAGLTERVDLATRNVGLVEQVGDIEIDAPIVLLVAELHVGQRRGRHLQGVLVVAP